MRYPAFKYSLTNYQQKESNYSTGLYMDIEQIFNPRNKQFAYQAGSNRNWINIYCIRITFVW